MALKPHCAGISKVICLSNLLRALFYANSYEFRLLVELLRTTAPKILYIFVVTHLLTLQLLGVAIEHVTAYCLMKYIYAGQIIQFIIK